VTRHRDLHVIVILLCLTFVSSLRFLWFARFSSLLYFANGKGLSCRSQGCRCFRQGESGSEQPMMTMNAHSRPDIRRCQSQDSYWGNTCVSIRWAATHIHGLRLLQCRYWQPPSFCRSPPLNFSTTGGSMSTLQLSWTRAEARN
jgi:hypothetical protein